MGKHTARGTRGERRGGAGSRRARTGRAQAHDAASAGQLPALSTLSELPGFGELCASETQRAAFSGACERAVAAGAVAEELVMGFVARLDRGFPAVVSAAETFRAEFSARLTKAGLDGSAPARVAVGDWVCARRPHGHDMGLIEEILPRESDIARWRGSARGERQTLAANVGLVLVVQQLGARAVSCDRIARSAVVAADCGADFAVVLTKADRASAEVLAADVFRVRDVLGPDVPLVALARPSGDGEGTGDATARAEGAVRALGLPWGIEAVRALVPAGTVAIVLGESGAGKSTLLNALLGRESLETGAVRASDDAGRHTTVARRMVSIPGGGVIVDEPGLRSLPLVGHERGLARVFPEIARAARGCRFRDCTHTHEPGCEVRPLLAEGSLSQPRLDAYLALAREMRASADSLDPDVVL